MKTVILIQFGSPANPQEVRTMVQGILNDPEWSVFHNNPFLSLFKLPIQHCAIRKSIKKYESIKFDANYISQLTVLKENLARELTPSPVFLAAQYGAPTLEEILEKMEDANLNRAVMVPLYPHASLKMYSSIVGQGQKLQQGFFRNMHFSWTAPFFDHPLFIAAWVDQIKKSLYSWFPEKSEAIHLVFCAHAHPRDGFEAEYERQVQITARKIIEALGANNPFSFAYQSAAPFGKWTGPSLAGVIKRLSSGKVSQALVIPVSFLFDNIETLVDIDSIAIPRARALGISGIKRAAPPGNSPKITEMLSGMIKKT